MSSKNPTPAVWRRPDVYAGLMFIGVALLGLYLSASYSMGTAVRMGTGYVPRLLCWCLLGLGCIVLLQGLFTRIDKKDAFAVRDLAVMRPLFFVALATVVFALTIETLGFIMSLLATMTVGSIAARGMRPIVAIIAMMVLTVTCWGIFSYGLALPFPVWPRL